MLPAIKKWLDDNGELERRKRFEKSAIANHGSLENFYKYRGAKAKEARIAKLGETGYSKAQRKVGKIGGRPPKLKDFPLNYEEIDRKR